MKNIHIAIILLGFSTLLMSCAGGENRGRTSHQHDHGPWSDGRDYYHERIVVPPPENKPVVPAYEAKPLPSEPNEMPDEGMSDTGSDAEGDDF